MKYYKKRISVPMSIIILFVSITQMYNIAKWYNMTITTITTTTAGGKGGRKSSIPAISLDTLRGKRNGDPQHEMLWEKW